jgi:adenosylcobinamide-phosphate synthase
MHDRLLDQSQPLALLLAIGIDAWYGDPVALYRIVPHPVALIGRFIAWAEARFNRENDMESRRRRAGIELTLALVLGAFAIGAVLQWLLLALPLGRLWLAIVMSTLIAQRSLYGHVADVAGAVEVSGVEGGRIAVARIVGRDPNRLDKAGVCRAAVESLAENFSDGIVAPVFWALLVGLPGLLAYKAINTADSMIGHKSVRYRDFGWAAARLDDLVNLPASRLSALLLTIGALLMPGASATAAISAVFRDARHHRSPNAGWPEAAMAGALGFCLNGPRFYGGQPSGDGWMNENGRKSLDASDIRQALRLYLRTCILLAVPVAIVAFFTH